jgi:hypothetical protein
MKTITVGLLCGGAVLVLLAGAGVGRGTEPEGAVKRGKVLILENEQTLEGDIEQVGDQYRIRRTVGETWVPAQGVLGLCASREEAFRLLRSRANLRDPDERLRLANWCLQHGLRELALPEVEAAVELRPGHARSRQILANLRQSARMQSPRPAAPAGGARRPKGPEASPNVDLTADSLGLFASKVQPILMNACANCHAAGKGGAFKLTRAHDVGTLTGRTTQQNLTAVLAQVNLHDPVVSPLLTKSVISHGGVAQAPLRGRQAPAYRALEDWVRLTLAHNPQLQGRPGGPAPAGPAHAPHAPAPARSDTHWGEDHGPPPTPAAPASAPASPAPAAAEAVDPVDPEVFNRQFHPGGKAPPPAPKPRGSGARTGGRS